MLDLDRVPLAYAYGRTQIKVALPADAAPEIHFLNQDCQKRRGTYAVLKMRRGQARRLRGMCLTNLRRWMHTADGDTETGNHVCPSLCFVMQEAKTANSQAA